MPLGSFDKPRTKLVTICIDKFILELLYSIPFPRSKVMTMAQAKVGSQFSLEGAQLCMRFQPGGATRSPVKGRL